MLISEKTDKILPALAKVKSELQAVTKKANNPFFKSKYADLNTYLEEVEPLLEKNGLVLLQPPTVSDGIGNTVVSKIFHVETGQFVGGSMKLVGETDMQKAGSAVTYARRYILSGLLSMQAIDDDGNTASNKANPGARVSAASPAAKPQVTVAASVAPTPNALAIEAKPGFRNPRKVAAPPVVISKEEVSTSSGDDL